MSFLRNLVGTDFVAKAARDALPAPAGPPRSRELSPRDYLLSLTPEALGDEHPGAMGMHYGLLLAMARVPVVASIIQTRINQVVDFSRWSEDKHRNGWVLRMRDDRKSPTSAALKSIDKLRQVIERAGRDFQPVTGGFEGFLSAITRDSLTYDQVNFEVLFSRFTGNEKGRLPVGFVYVDPSTIRRAKPSEKELRAGRIDPTKKTAYVQILEDRVVNEYGVREMAFGIRRPRSAVHARGYGYPELETLMGVVANLLKAETWNAKKFTTGIRADQIITINSDMSAEMFEAVRRIVWAMLSGTNNNQRVPLLQLSPDLKEELKVHPLGQNATDMQFREWINFLIKLSCALYQMDPAELGFVFGNEGQSSSLNSTGPAERIAASKERGLHPLLRAIAGWINEMIVWQWDPDLEFAFTGYDSITPKERQELETGAVKTVRSVNEVRAGYDLDPLEMMSGDINIFDLPLDATVINAALSLGQGGGEDEGGGFGGEDEGGGFGGFGDDDEEDAAEPPGAEEDGQTEKAARPKAHYHGNVAGVDDLVALTVTRYEERARQIEQEIRSL